MTSIQSSSVNSAEQSRGPARQAPLTAEQKTKIAEILKNYDPSELSTDDVKQINAAFSEAGIHRGPALREGISSAGFNPEDLRTSSDPQIKKGNRPPPPPPLKVDVEQLQTLKDILSNFDLSNLNSSERNDLITQLESAGISRSGNVVDVSA